MSIEVHIVEALRDNYVYVLRDEAEQHTSVIDPSEYLPVKNFLTTHNWQLTQIINTHHHPDHVGGNQQLKQEFGCAIIGSEPDKDRIPGLDKSLKDGETFKIGSSLAKAILLPGHTFGHMAVYIESENLLFTGDTLFSVGCGRLFEGQPKQMLSSLVKLMKLPKETKIYCGHEYTVNNAKFALSLEPNNLDLKEYYQDSIILRSQNKPTVPTTLEKELKVNPFLRTSSLEIRKILNLKDASHLEVFTKIRQLKDIH